MNVLELTQRQRELLGNIAKAASQYRQAVADASARLERENEQIEQSRRQERQRIEEEREQKTKIILKPAKDEEAQKRREERLQREIAAKRSTTTPPISMTTIEAVKRNLNDLFSTKISAGSPIELAIKIVAILALLVALLSSCYGYYLWFEGSSDEGEYLALVCCAAFFIGFPLLFWGNERVSKKLESAVVNRIVLLHSLYDRWLELVDERAGAQRAEA